MPDTDADCLQKNLAFDGVVPAVIRLPDVDVLASSDKNKNICFRDVNRIGPIPKDCTIQFTIREPWNLPPGVIVEWVVRNEGIEAEEKNDLGHIAHTGLHSPPKRARNCSSASRS